MSLKGLKWVAVLLAVCLGISGAARADSLRWTLNSDHPNVVDLEFYSQDYNRAWPGNGKVYYIDDYNKHTYTLNCRYGEKICYGAWVRNDESTYWGVGPDNRYSCSNCCGVCGKGDMVGITLRR